MSNTGRFKKGFKPWNFGLRGYSGQRAWNKGKRLPKWYKKKLSKAHQGKVLSTSHRKNISKGICKWIKKHPIKSLRGIQVARDGSKLSKPQLWLFRSLRKRGFHPKLELRVGNFWIDIALVKQKIAIEVDGAYWHKNLGKERRRDKFLKKRDWKVIHVVAKMKIIKKFKLEEIVN